MNPVHITEHPDGSLSITIPERSAIRLALRLRDCSEQPDGTLFAKPSIAESCREIVEDHYGPITDGPICAAIIGANRLLNDGGEIFAGRKPLAALTRGRRPHGIWQSPDVYPTERGGGFYTDDTRDGPKLRAYGELIVLNLDEKWARSNGIVLNPVTARELAYDAITAQTRARLEQVTDTIADIMSQEPKTA